MGSERFSIDNSFQRVSFRQFKTAAEKLESALRGVRPTIESELFLTTNWFDYRAYGSLTVSIPETEQARARRERFQLPDLSEGLWEVSFKTEFYIFDRSIKEPYMAALSAEDKEPTKLFFYSQQLDEVSQRVFDNFKRVKLFQKLGDGYPKSSDFAVSYAVTSLTGRR